MNKDDVLAPPAEPTATYDRLFRSVAGGLIGGAAADALGWITEFVRGPEHLRSLYRTDYVTTYRPWQKLTGGRFNAYVDHINRGEYSDDTQLTLAVARSIGPNGAFDVEHFANLELPLWLDYARGGGRTITAAAKSMQRRSARWNRNFFTYNTRGGEASYRSAGANGAAMRVAPIALANPSQPETMVRGVWESSIATHGHPRAIVGALAQAEAVRLCVLHHRGSAGPHHILEDVREFISGAEIPAFPGLADWLREWNAKPHADFQTEWKAAKQEMVDGIRSITQPEVQVSPSEAMRRFGCFDPATKGSGTGTVLAGFALFYAFGDNVRRAVEVAVNQLGTDTDTIGAFVGTLSGAHMGFEEIPRDWAMQLQDYDYFMRVATELAAIAAGDGIGNAALLPKRSASAKEPDLVDLIRAKNVSARDVVYHPLFGRGVVESVEAQNLRRRDGARAIFARVQFYIGQSAKFRYLEFPKGRKRPGRAITPPLDDTGRIPCS